MPYVNEDTSEEHGYALSKLEDGKEVFFSRHGISFGRGKSWELSPARRLELQLNLPDGVRTTPRDRYPSTPGKKRKEHDRNSREFDAFNSSEFLGLLRRLLEANAPCELPDDALVIRAQMRADIESYFQRKPERPYIQRDLEVLVISNSWDEVSEGQRFPSLK